MVNFVNKERALQWAPYLCCCGQHGTFEELALESESSRLYRSDNLVKLLIYTLRSFAYLATVEVHCLTPSLKRVLHAVYSCSLLLVSLAKLIFSRFGVDDDRRIAEHAALESNLNCALFESVSMFAEFQAWRT